MSISPLPVVTNRKISGVSAILLPFLENGEVDWIGFRNHVLRTWQAGLTPAVNMDTGYGNLIDHDLRSSVLKETREIVGQGNFVAGAFVGDRPGDAFNLSAYGVAIEGIESAGGIPVIFQSFGLTEQSDEAIVFSYQELSKTCDRMIAFELGQVFAPFGAIYSLAVFSELVQIQNCIGAKHSSLSREEEWSRLEIRNRLRPDFKIYTGNDLAIDMVIYGSDYLLGLSTFAPDYFALRDSYWASGDSRFFELNDVLQYLGFFAFRDPVPAYKHDAAMFLQLRNWIETGKTHVQSPVRPDSDREVLGKILKQLENFS